MKRILIPCLVSLFLVACTSREPGPAPDPLEQKIVVSDDPASSKRIGGHPWGDRNFEKDIQNLKGKTISNLIGLDRIRRIVIPRDCPEDALWNPVDITNGLVLSALRTGTIIPGEENPYHLQVSREFVVETDDTVTTVGIYYEPIGYIRFQNGQSYWFLFGSGVE